MIIHWLNNQVQLKGRYDDKEELSKIREMRNPISKYVQHWHNRLSFVIVVKWGEFLEVYINAKCPDIVDKFGL